MFSNILFYKQTTMKPWNPERLEDFQGRSQGEWVIEAESNQAPDCKVLPILVHTALPRTVSMSKLITFSVPQFSHLLNGDIISTSLFEFT